MGIDHGIVRIGVALSDPMKLVATPHSVIVHTTNLGDFRKLQEIAQSTECCMAVVGLPTDSKGGIGHQAQIVLNWARKLRPVIEIPIILWDESYSSTSAEQYRSSKKRSNKARMRHQIDSIAAAYILQEYLDMREDSNGEPGTPLEAFHTSP